MLEAIIFDMDGVILDSEYGFVNSKQQVLQELGVNIDKTYHYKFFGTTFEYVWTEMKKEFNLPISVEEGIERGEKIRKEIKERDGLKTIPGVLDLIKHFHESGVKLAIASSSPMEDIIETVETFNIKDCFEVLVTGRDCENSKPFPDVFLKAAEELKVDPKNCIVIEDSKNGTIAAKAAGMVCIGYNNPEFNCIDLSKADKVIEYFKDIDINICKNILENMND